MVTFWIGISSGEMPSSARHRRAPPRSRSVGYPPSGGQSELRVGEQHAVPVLVPYLGKRLLPFPGRETCLAGIEQAVVGVGFPVGLPDVMDVGDDKGLPDLSEAAHLMRGHYHDHLI